MNNSKQNKVKSLKSTRNPLVFEIKCKIDEYPIYIKAGEDLNHQCGKQVCQIETNVEDKEGRKVEGLMHILIADQHLVEDFDKFFLKYQQRYQFRKLRGIPKVEKETPCDRISTSVGNYNFYYS